MDYSHFAPPSSLKLDCSNLEQSWKFWSQKFDLYMTASGANEKPESTQLAIFLHLIGDDALQVYNTFTFASEAERKMDVVRQKFADYCQPRRNIVYERYQFWRLNQAPGENIDAFVTSLRLKAKSCDFGTQEDSMIRDRIVLGCPDPRLQERLLREPDLTLAKALPICRAAEATKEQLRAIAGTTSVHHVEPGHGAQSSSRKTRPRGRGTIRPEVDRNRSEVQSQPSCRNCGRNHPPKSCPAYKQICRACQKEGHFANCCRSSRRRSSSRPAHGHRVQHMTSSSAESAHPSSSSSSTVHVLQESPDTMFVGHLHIDSCQKSSQSCWWKQFNINNTSVRCKLDTGAEANVMSSAVFESLSQPGTVHRASTVLTAYGNSKLCPLGVASLTLEHAGKRWPVEFFVVDVPAPTIVGLPTCTTLDVVRRIDAVQPATTPALLVQYADVFEGLGEMPGQYHIELDQSVTPVIHAPRKVPIALQSRLKSALDDMEQKGVIRKCDGPTDWVSSLLIVEKKNGSLRLCLDPRDLNKAVKREHFVLPTCEDVLAKLHGKSIFTIIDQTDGFWQVSLDDVSSKLCTFNTPFGRYSMRRLPFGLSSSPEVFQKRNMEIFGDIDNAHIVFDDMIIAAATDSEHDETLRAVFERAREKNVKFNRSKIQYKVSEVSFLGHRISGQGVRPQDDKVKAIRDMPTPQSRAELQRFLGMITYVSKFIPHFSVHTDPLRQLLRKNIDWQWSHEHDEAFNRLKALLQSAPTLKYFDPADSAWIQTDSSSKGLGSCLLQRGRPIAFASRALTDAECNYSQIEKELLSIVFACEKFSQYIYGRLTVVQSDHKPLEAIYKKQISATTPRLQRMLLRLMKYSLRIEYLPGPQMFIADTLSRAYLPHKPTDADRELADDIDVTVHSVIASYPASDQRLSELRAATQSDPALSVVRQCLRDGIPKDSSSLLPESKQLLKSAANICDIDGLLFLNGKLIIPQSMRKLILDIAHEGHLGIEKTKQLARTSVHWSGMTSDIERLVSKCSTCQSFQRSQQREPLMPHPVPDRVWQKISADIFTLDGTDYLIVIDFYSHFPEIARLESKTASSVIIHLKSLFARYGIPEVLLSDNMPFNSKPFHDFASDWNFNLVWSSPRFPQSNGMVERAVQTVKMLLKKAKSEGKDPYIALLQYRCAPLAGSQFSPAQLMMNRTLRTKLPASPQLFQPIVVDARDQLVARQQQQKDVYDRSSKPLPPLQKGDVVRLRHNGESQRAIVRDHTDTPRSFVVETEDGSTLRRNRRHLRPTAEDSPTIAPHPLDESDTQPVAQQSSTPAQLPAASSSGQPPPSSIIRRSTRTHKPPVRFNDYVMTVLY